MKGTIIVLAIVAFASALLVAPNFREFKDGLYVSVTKHQRPGQSYPTFNVTVFNPTEKAVQTECLVRDILPESEDQGIMTVDTGERTPLDNFPHTTSAYEDFVLDVPAMSPRTFSFTKKIYSPYN